jgi:hypothetical protein
MGITARAGLAGAKVFAHACAVGSLTYAFNVIRQCTQVAGSHTGRMTSLFKRSTFEAPVYKAFKYLHWGMAVDWGSGYNGLVTSS